MTPFVKLSKWIFGAHVNAVGEVGCGYEAPLEAWYRFLIDPSLPLDLVIGSNGGSEMATNENGQPLVDGTVLAQREAFLRPEGLVAIVLLTDENDCSAMDGGSYYNNAGFGHLIAERPQFDNGVVKTRAMPVAPAICDTNPNGRCCFSCLRKTVPEGCDASACENLQPVPDEDDRANTRCFANRRRFGIDLLYPTSRYVEALSSTTIVDARTGKTVNNPLFLGVGESNQGKVRALDRVFFAGIVGVPWQDIATDESLNDSSVMEYRTAAELLEPDVKLADGSLVNRWDVILGDPGLSSASAECRNGTNEACGRAPVHPLDPFMIESIAPRTAGLTNPISGDQIVDFSSNDPQANEINGHEVNHLYAATPGDPPANDDLQYACIFPLETPKLSCTDDDLSCDCGNEPSKNRPLCQQPGGSTAGKDQHFGKAYPGTRILEVLRDFGDNSIVGSICPKIAVSNDLQDVNYGYNPAVQAIVKRLADKLQGKCLPRELTLEPDGTVPCAVVETRPFSEGALDCSAPGRGVVDEVMREAIIAQLKENDLCGDNSGIPCNDYSMCAIDELVGDARDQCFFDERDPATFAEPGYCYIDPAKKDEDGKHIAGGDENGNNPIVKECSSSERRLLRFVGVETPAKGTNTFVACTADAASVRDEIPALPEETSESDDAASP